MTTSMDGKNMGTMSGKKGSSSKDLDQVLDKSVIM